MHPRFALQFFYKNGVPKWKGPSTNLSSPVIRRRARANPSSSLFLASSGTGYFCSSPQALPLSFLHHLLTCLPDSVSFATDSRWRPGFFTVLVFLGLLTSAFQHLFRTLNHTRDLKRITDLIASAQHIAWTNPASKSAGPDAPRVPVTSKDAKKKVTVPLGGGGRTVECMVMREGEVYLVSPPFAISIFAPLFSIAKRKFVADPRPPPTSPSHPCPRSQLDPPSEPTLLTPSTAVGPAPQYTDTWPFALVRSFTAVKHVADEVLEGEIDNQAATPAVTSPEASSSEDERKGTVIGGKKEKKAGGARRR